MPDRTFPLELRAYVCQFGLHDFLHEARHVFTSVEPANDLPYGRECGQKRVEGRPVSAYDAIEGLRTVVGEIEPKDGWFGL